MLTIAEEVIELAVRTLSVPQDAQAFTPTYDLSEEFARRLLHDGIKITGITGNYERHRYFAEDIGERKLSLTDSKEPQLFNPTDKFHVAFGILPFDVDMEIDDNRAIKPAELRDTAMQFRCSQGRKNRIASAHLLLMEQMLASVHAGGFIVAVLPKKWLGKEMKYLRWWEDRCATVARIKLPAGAVKDVTFVQRPVTCDWIVPVQDDEFVQAVVVEKPFCVAVDYSPKHDPDDYKAPRRPMPIEDRVERNVPGDWELRIFFRPFSRTYATEFQDSAQFGSKLEWATHRWQMVQHRLKNLETESIVNAIRAIQATEWETVTLKNWRAMLEAHKGNSVIGTKHWKAVGLPDVSDIAFFEPTDKTIYDIKVVSDLAELKKNPRAIHVVQTRSKIRLRGYNDITVAGITDIESRMGFSYDEKAKKYQSKLSLQILGRDIYSVKEQLVQVVVNAGFEPCMTVDDARRMKKRQRWLDIQLTPLPRYIPVKDEDAASGAAVVWENIYEDVDLKATFPEVYQLWEQRARKMKMDSVLFGFQFDDVVHQAAKQSIVNGNLMGLGKTRENLMAAILRGSQKVLIISPSKLIGTWQDEIDNTVIPYCRRVRRHWSGKSLSISAVNVINHASDCVPDRLRQFNIIGFDKLKRTPRDGRFYKCPKCGFVVYSANNKPQICPGDPKESHPDPDKDKSCMGPIRRYNAAKKLRDEVHGQLLYRRYKVLSSDMTTKVHWCEDHPSRQTAAGIIKDEDCTIVDDRKNIVTGSGLFNTGKPRPVKMVMQDTMFSKQVKVPGESKRDETTGKLKKTWKLVNRDSHVKWTFSELLRLEFDLIIVDEVMYAANADSLRARAMNHMAASTRWVNTGTPMKGMPQNLLNYFNWAIDRQAFPDYRLTEPGGLRRFLDKYMTTIKVDCTRLPDGTAVGGKDKQIPKVNNPELFQTELSPFILRHLRSEPEVLKAIPKIPQNNYDESIPMDDEHRAYYQKWIDKFVEWYEEMKKENEGKNVKANILTKMSYLTGASTNPHFMLDSLMNPKRDKNGHIIGDKDFRKWAELIGRYKGPMTAKMKRTMQLIAENRARHEKTIIGTIRRKTLELGAGMCNRLKLHSLIVHGGISNEIETTTMRSPRHMLVAKFRQDPSIAALWAGMGSLAEGFNIPEANNCVIYDVGWEPQLPLQLIGRMLRPQQKHDVNSWFLMHEGTIDEYMFAICILKGRSHNEGIDYMDFDDLSTEMIPDIQQYAQSIVDGTSHILKRQMWLAVEHLRKQWDDQEDEFPIDDLDDDDDDNGNKKKPKKPSIGDMLDYE